MVKSASATRRVSLSTAFFVMACFFASMAIAASPSLQRNAADDAGNPTDSIASKWTRAESLAMPVVNEHLPELKPLLKRLQDKQPQQYRDAIFDLAKSARRIESARQRSPEAYAIEIECLQAKSNVNLLVARLKVRDLPDDRSKLREAVQRMVAAEQSRLDWNVEAARQRLEKSEQLLQQASQRASDKSSRRDVEIDQTVRALLRRAGLENRKPK